LPEVGSGAADLERANFAATGLPVCLPTIYSTYYHIELTRTLFYTFIVAGAQVVAHLCAVGVIDVPGRKQTIVLGYGIARALAFTKATTETSRLITAMTYAFLPDMGSLAMRSIRPRSTRCTSAPRAPVWCGA
jgi:hypothetical protein